MYYFPTYPTALLLLFCYIYITNFLLIGRIGVEIDGHIDVEFRGGDGTPPSMIRVPVLMINFGGREEVGGDIIRGWELDCLYALKLSFGILSEPEVLEYSHI